jgi:histidinol-phosphate aminotransferase
MAGIRLGAALAHPDIVDVLLRVKAPYNVNTLTAATALEALTRGADMLRTVDAVRSERRRLGAALTVLPVVQQVFPSQANFLLVRFRNARAVHAHLTSRGIIVRDRSTEPRLDNCLRITVGTPEENNALITALREISA